MTLGGSLENQAHLRELYPNPTSSLSTISVQVVDEIDHSAQGVQRRSRD
jgi:hypothetical protein